jgi:hypothetical protein
MGMSISAESARPGTAGVTARMYWIRADQVARDFSLKGATSSSDMNRTENHA